MIPERREGLEAAHFVPQFPQLSPENNDLYLKDCNRCKLLRKSRVATARCEKDRCRSHRE